PAGSAGGAGRGELRGMVPRLLQGLTGMHSMEQGRKRWRIATVVLLVAAVVVAMLLTSGQMSELRRAVPLLSRGMSWLEGLPLPFDMDHVALFAALGATLRLLLPRARWWLLLPALAGLAAGAELLQYLTIGRSPSVLDVRDDM